jgi:hypothetical protein
MLNQSLGVFKVLKGASGTSRESRWRHVIPELCTILGLSSTGLEGKRYKAFGSSGCLCSFFGPSLSGFAVSHNIPAIEYKREKFIRDASGLRPAAKGEIMKTRRGDVREKSGTWNK